MVIKRFFAFTLFCLAGNGPLLDAQETSQGEPRGESPFRLQCGSSLGDNTYLCHFPNQDPEVSSTITVDGVVPDYDVGPWSMAATWESDDGQGFDWFVQCGWKENSTRTEATVKPGLTDGGGRVGVRHLAAIDCIHTGNGHQWKVGDPIGQAHDGLAPVIGVPYPRVQEGVSTYSGYADPCRPFDGWESSSGEPPSESETTGQSTAAAEDRRLPIREGEADSEGDVITYEPCNNNHDVYEDSTGICAAGVQTLTQDPQGDYTNVMFWKGVLYAAFPPIGDTCQDFWWTCEGFYDSKAAVNHVAKEIRFLGGTTTILDTRGLSFYFPLGNATSSMLTDAYYIENVEEWGTHVWNDGTDVEPPIVRDIQITADRVWAFPDSQSYPLNLPPTTPTEPNCSGGTSEALGQDFKVAVNGEVWAVRAVIGAVANMDEQFMVPNPTLRQGLAEAVMNHLGCSSLDGSSKGDVVWVVERLASCGNANPDCFMGTGDIWSQDDIDRLDYGFSAYSIVNYLEMLPVPPYCPPEL